MRPEDNHPLTLVLGDQHAWERDGRALPVIPGFKFLDIAALTPITFMIFPAQIVLSPLVVRDIDVIGIARTLVEIGFQGRYRAIADSLPEPELIMAEVAAVAPDLDFEIFNLPHLGIGI